MARTEFIVTVASIVIVAGVIAIPLASPAATVAPLPAPLASSSATANPDGLVGAGCPTYATTAASVSKETVSQAIAAIPTLSSFSAAISGKTNTGVNLVSKLDGSQVTVFVPVDAAFAKLPVTTQTSFKNPADASALIKILDYHVVPSQFAPAAIGGTHTTLQGETVTVTSTGTALVVGGANVICGGIHTSNGTLYLIDTVLSPPATN
jgi:uncharacterized surface protein with fasciclin (FAS1) repeats